MAANNYRKRRIVHGPSKNELRAARGEKADMLRSRAGGLRQRFPNAEGLELDIRLELATGGILDQSRRIMGPDEPLLLDVACPGGCGGGLFLLTDMAESLLQSRAETREGMAICQATSYRDPKMMCGTKLFYRISIHYGSVLPASENNQSG